MILEAYIVDTSYLCELFKVPGCSNDAASAEVRQRWEQAVENDARIYVPLPCIFELGSHIADVKDGNTRRALAIKLHEMVELSLENAFPLTIVPQKGVKVSPRLCILCEDFKEKHALEGIDLTDTCTIEEAHRLKKKYKGGFNYRVHIWTKDTKLKAKEPDMERNPFLG